MNYQQYRTISSSSSLPAFQLLYALPDNHNHPHPPRNAADTHQNSSRFFQKQIHTSKQPLSEFKGDFQYSKINSQPSGPLNFSLATPQKLKTKKTGRPMAKISHKSQIATSPKQPEGDFSKEESSQMTRMQFSKTTGVLYPFQVQTESSPLKQHTDTGSNQSLRGLVGRQSKSKILDPPAFDGSSSYNPILGTRNQQFLLETIHSQKMEIKSFQGEIVHVNMQLRALREKEERNELRASRKKEESERMQLQLKAEQNSKLLVEIQSMEKELRGRQELNRYLEHQCSTYLAENTALKEAAENCRGELVKKEEVISVLHREIDELEQGIANHRQKTVEFQSEKLRLNRALQSQRESMQQMQMSSDVDKSEIYMLRMKIETLQKKYEQLMGNIVEVQSAFTLKEETFLEEQKGLQSKLQQYQLSKGMLEKNLQEREAENHQLLKHCEQIDGEVHHFTKVISQKEREHQQVLKKLQQQKQYWAQMTEQLQKSLAESLRETQAREKTKITRIEKLQHQIQAEKQRQAELQQAFKKFEEEKIYLNEQLHKAEDAIKERDHRILLLESSLQRCEQKLQIQSSQLGIRQGQLKRAQEYSASLQVRLEKLMTEYEIHLRDLRQALVSSDKEKSSWQEECSALSEKLTTLGSTYESLRQSNIQLQALHSEVLSRSCSYANSNHQLQGMYSVLQEQYLHVSTRLKEIQEERDSLKIQNGQLGTRSSEKERELMNLRQLYSKGVEELSTLEDRTAALREDNRRLRVEKEELQGLATELRREISSLLLIVEENEKRYQSDIKNWEQLITNKDREMGSSVALFEKARQNMEATISQLITNHSAQSQQQSAELHSREQLIMKMKETISELTAQIQEEVSQCKDSPVREALNSKGWASSQSLDSHYSEEAEGRQQIASMGDLGQGQVNYIEMDREGIDYLCELLAIETSQGNLLTQIVGEVENILERHQKEEGEISQYRQLLSQFGVEAKPFGLKTLLTQVQAAKEHLCLLVNRLAEEEKRNDLILRENQELVGMQEIERECRQAYEKEEAALIWQLNDEITRLNARLANHRIQIKEALSLASQGCSWKTRSQAFVTARSFELLSEQ